MLTRIYFIFVYCTVFIYNKPENHQEIDYDHEVFQTSKEITERPLPIELLWMFGNRTGRDEDLEECMEENIKCHGMIHDVGVRICAEYKGAFKQFRDICEMNYENCKTTLMMTGHYQPGDVYPPPSNSGFIYRGPKILTVPVEFIEYDDEDIRLPKSATGRPVPIEIIWLIGNKTAYDWDLEYCMAEYAQCSPMLKYNSPICAEKDGEFKVFRDICDVNYNNCVWNLENITMVSTINPPLAWPPAKPSPTPYKGKVAWNYVQDKKCPDV